MKLFLASEAKNPPTFAKLTEYIGGFNGKSVAYIPTAANGETAWGDWQNGETYNLVKKQNAKIEIVLLEDYKNDSVIEKLTGKDVIWFAGGFCGYLMYWILRCDIDKHIRKLLEKSIYVGSSAGAMITSPDLNVSVWHPIDIERPAAYLPGLGLIDFDIYPHYNESQLESIKQNYKGKKLYLLKNGEEIIVEDGKITLSGKERIISR